MNGLYLPKPALAILAGALCALFLLLPSAGAAGQQPRVDRTIEHLLAYVEHSDLVFVRNGRNYTAREASEHMQKKYAHFRDKITTAEDFIDLCASRSLLTGKPYLVIDESGDTRSTRDWLSAELARYRHSAAGPAR